MSDASSLKVKVKIQILCGEAIAMGPGKADLLDAIICHGSISAAARALDMSYRRAWLLVDTMNRCWREPLVATTAGNHKAGARLTATGASVLEHYRALQRQGAKLGDSDVARRLEQLVLDTPRPAQNAPG